MKGPRAADRTLAMEVLPPALQPLFLSMNTYGQRHAADVCRRLMADGCHDGPTLQAALLHDVGKGTQPLLARAIVVLMERFAPEWLHKLGRCPGGRWAFLFRDRRHARTSADLVLLAGGSPDVAGIIAGHYHPMPRDPRIRALRRADDRH